MQISIILLRNACISIIFFCGKSCIFVAKYFMSLIYSWASCISTCAFFHLCVKINNFLFLTSNHFLFTVRSGVNPPDPPVHSHLEQFAFDDSGNLVPYVKGMLVNIGDVIIYKCERDYAFDDNFHGDGFNITALPNGTWTAVDEWRNCTRIDSKGEEIQVSNSPSLFVVTLCSPVLSGSSSS